MRGITRALLAGCILFAFCEQAVCQGKPGKLRPSIVVDFGKGGFDVTLPFDTPFTISGESESTLRFVQAYYCDTTGWTSAQHEYLRSHEPTPQKPHCDAEETKAYSTTKWNPSPIASEKKFFLNVTEALEANHEFAFFFHSVSVPTDEELTKIRAQLTVDVDAALRKQFDAKGEGLASDDLIDAFGTSQSFNFAPQTQARFVAARVGDDTWEELVEELRGANDGLRVPQESFGRLQQPREEALKALNSAVRHSGLVAGLAEAMVHGDPQIKSQANALLAGSKWDLVRKIANINQFDLVASGDELLQSDPKIELPTRLVSEAWQPGEVEPRIEVLSANEGSIREFFEIIRDIDAYTYLAKSLSMSKENREEILVLAERSAVTLSKGASDCRRLAAALKERQSAIQSAVARATAEVSFSVVIDGSTVGNLSTRASNHISVDISYAYTLGTSEFVPYIGTKFYARPVNREVPLKIKGGFWRRASAVVGLTVSSMQEKNGAGAVVRDDLFGSTSAIVGGSYRVFDYFSVSVGGVVFKERVDPLDSSLSTRFDTYVSVGFDWNIKALLGSLGGK